MMKNLTVHASSVYTFVELVLVFMNRFSCLESEFDYSLQHFFCLSFVKIKVGIKRCKKLHYKAFSPLHAQ